MMMMMMMMLMMLMTTSKATFEYAMLKHQVALHVLHYSQYGFSVSQTSLHVFLN